MGDDVAPTLEETLRAEVFYFDAITQLQMDTWSRGRVTLVGDAGYCPGPAVGGSTSLAVVGAFTLAGELAVAGGDHTVAFPAYERAMADYVQRSRAFAVSVAGRLIPRTHVQAWAMTSGVRGLCSLPQPVLRAVVRSSTRRLGLHDSIVPLDYPASFGARLAERPPRAGTSTSDPLDPAS